MPVQDAQQFHNGFALWVTSVVDILYYVMCYLNAAGVSRVLLIYYTIENDMVML